MDTDTDADSDVDAGTATDTDTDADAAADPDTYADADADAAGLCLQTGCLFCWAAPTCADWLPVSRLFLGVRTGCLLCSIPVFEFRKLGDARARGNQSPTSNAYKNC